MRTLEVGILTARPLLTFRFVLVAAIFAVPGAVAPPVFADAALLVLALERVFSAGVRAVKFILPLWTVSISVTDPTHVDTATIATGESSIWTAGTKQLGATVHIWAICFIGSIPAVIVAVAAPFRQNAVGGSCASNQILGSIR